MTLDENPVANSAGQISDHAALKAAYDARGIGPALATYTATTTDAEHRAIHASLHAEYNALQAGTVLPTGLAVGQAGHLEHHAALHTAHNARSLSVVSRVYRGVNLSGAEFAPDAAHLPGVANTDYIYPSSADLRYIAGRGHDMIRLPIRWERVQPNLFGALNGAELARLVSTISQANTSGMRVLLDLHNYARFINSKAHGGATLTLGDGSLSNAHLSDLWTRLSIALKGNAGILGYGLMNEPHDLPELSGAFTSSRTVWNFDAGAQAWSGESGAVASFSTTSNTIHDGSGSLRTTRTLAAGPAQNIRVHVNASTTLVKSAGDTLSAWVLVPAGAPGTAWTAHLEMQTSSYQWVAGHNASLTPGTWARLLYTPTEATWLNHKGVGVQFTSTQVASASVSVFIDTVQQGSASAALSQSQQWERSSQACVDAIRANADTTPIYVPGFQWQGAQNWRTNHPAPWIKDPSEQTVYEAHYYFDGDNSGTYRKTYSAENSDAIGRGYSSLRDRATTELNRFLGWCGGYSVNGFVGEIGWSNTSDTASWNMVGDALYKAMDVANVGASVWAAGAWYGTSYNLSVYRGTPLSTRAAQAGTVEAHPGFTR